MTRKRSKFASVGFAIFAAAVLYIGAYFVRGKFVREHLVCHREFKTQSEMNLFAPLWRIEDYLREIQGEEFLPGFERLI
jgi:hypothetical protein